MAPGARRINMGTLFTNNKLPSIHSELLPRSRSKAAHSTTPTTVGHYTLLSWENGRQSHSK